MKYILVLLSLCIYIQADILILNEKEELEIRSKKNKNVIIKRFNNYYSFLDKAKNYNLDKKLIRTNLHINRIISKFDEKGSNSWSFPKEFLTNGYGDCEDYAITKYFSLDYLGISRDDLYFAVVKVRGSTFFHMVLLYMDKNNISYVLDNLSWKVLPLSKRKDLIFKFAFNDKASYYLKNNTLVKEKNIKRGEVFRFKKMLLENK